MAVGLVAVPERADNGGLLLPGAEDEQLRHAAPGMGIVLGDGAVQHPGTLYVTTRRLIWLSDNDHRKGYAVDFRSLSMHAISRDAEAYPVPCIYTQIETANDDDDEDWDEVEEADGELFENENHVEEENLSSVSEMRLVPRDPSGLDQLFQLLCDCALLNPDSDGGILLSPVMSTVEAMLWFYVYLVGRNNSVEIVLRLLWLILKKIHGSVFGPFITEQEGEADWFFNVNEVLGSAVEEDENPGAPNIAALQIQDPRFEDAEEELEEEN